MGAPLSIVYSAECKAAQKTTQTAAMLPILVVLFIVSYGLLTMLVFEQGKTIESQRTLIRAMLQDSSQLAALKSKMAQVEPSQDPGKSAASGQDKNSSAMAAAPAPNKNQRAARPPQKMRQAPGKPQSDLEDVRRSTNII